MKDFFTENIKKEKPGSTGLGAALSYSSLLNEANEHYHKAEKLYEEIIMNYVKKYGPANISQATGYTGRAHYKYVLNGSIEKKKEFCEKIEENLAFLENINKKT